MKQVFQNNLRHRNSKLAEVFVRTGMSDFFGVLVHCETYEFRSPLPKVVDITERKLRKQHTLREVGWLPLACKIILYLPFADIFHHPVVASRDSVSQSSLTQCFFEFWRNL